MMSSQTSDGNGPRGLILWHQFPDGQP